MRIQALLFAAAAALSVNAFAEPPKASLAHRPTLDEARAMRGTYTLDDGRVLRITNQRSRVFAEIDGRLEELVPVAERTFVTHDSGERLMFDQLPFATELVFESVPRDRGGRVLAQAQPRDLPKRPAW
jgi:hypothetical protein